MIGKFLSMEINREKVVSMCPSQEDIAAFLDNKLGNNEKNAIMGHLCACKSCHEIFIETINIQDEPASKSNLPPKKILFKLISYSSAAAAAILITFFIARTTSMNKLSFVEDRVAALVKEIEKVSMPALLSGSKPSAVYGFADIYSVNSESFRAGICLTNIEIAMMTENKEISIVLLDEVIKLLKGIEGVDKYIESYKNIKKEIEEGVSMRILVSQIEKTVSGFKDPLHVYVRFGQWCEGGRIAAVHKTEKFFDPADVELFIKKLENKGLPKGVYLSLQKIKKILKEGAYSGKQFRRLEKEYENLILLI